MYKADVTVTYKKSVLDPQGNAVLKSLQSLGYQNVEQVRVGKHIEILLEAENAASAQVQLDEMCERLLSNPVIEDYQVSLSEVKQ